MALGIDYTTHRVNIKGSGGRLKIVKFTGDTDIPAAGTGYTVTAAQLGFGSTIFTGATGYTTDGVYCAVLTPSATGATASLRYFNVDDGVEAAVGENGVDATIVWMAVWGL